MACCEAKNRGLNIDIRECDSYNAGALYLLQASEKKRLCDLDPTPLFSVDHGPVTTALSKGAGSKSQRRFLVACRRLRRWTTPPDPGSPRVVHE